MKKRIFNLIVVLLLIVSMMCGCSNSATQTNNAVDTNMVSATQQNQTESKSALNPKLVEIYLNAITGYVKFDKDGRLWEKYNGSDQIRETSELIDYNIYRIYETDSKKTEYVSTIKTNMNNNMVLSEEYEKVIDNSSTKISINEYNEIKDKFESMKDYYDELLNANINKTNDKTIKVDLEIKNIADYDENTTIDEMDTVYFGNYEQELHQDKKPLEWIVLDKEGDKILLLSKYILDFKQYNDEIKDVTWETCSIRSWLNDYFYNAAFDDSEKSQIENTYVINTDNKSLGILGGNNTNDNVFLLSTDEVNKYFNQSNMWSDNKRLATRGTNYAKTVNNQYNSDVIIRSGEWYSDNNQFFLRSPGVTQEICTGVFANGALDGDIDGVVSNYCGIRPAIWVKGSCLKNNLNQKIFYYFTDDETTLHFSSKKPTSSNYVDGQYNWVELYDKYMGEGPKSNSLNEFNGIKANIQKVVFDNKVTPNSLKNIFDGCENLTSIDLRNLDTSRVKDMSGMFRNCKSLSSIDIMNFDTRKVEDMSGLFAFCENLIVLDISGFNFSNIKPQIFEGPNFKYLYPGTIGMFNGCSNLKTIYSNQDIQVNGNYDSTIMFDGCTNLVGGNGTKYNGALKDISFAVIDSNYQMGYFTYDPSKYYWKDGKYYVNGNLQKNKWITDIDNKYYLDNNGNTLKNQWKDNKYLGEDGKMLKNTYTPDNKYVNKDGNVVDLEKDFANIDKETVQLNAWYRTDNGAWYYFEGDRDTLKKGWFTDPQDSQTYYLDPTNGVMLTGWQTIDGNDYYFSTRSASEPNWYYVENSDIWLSYGKKIKALGSMFRDEETPDGRRVDKDGKLIS